MQTTLGEKLRSFLVHNAPDVLLGLKGSFSVTRYVEDKVYNVMPLVERLISEGKPQYVIEELCMDEMTKELRPSKFLYIRSLLEDEFLHTYKIFRERGVLTYETINMVSACKGLFDNYGFSEENMHSREFRYAMVSAIDEYLQNK